MQKISLSPFNFGLISRRKKYFKEKPKGNYEERLRLACNVLIKGNILRFLWAFRNNGWFQKVFTQYTSTFLKLYENETARKLSWPFIFHLYMKKGVSCRGEGRTERNLMGEERKRHFKVYASFLDHCRYRQKSTRKQNYFLSRALLRACVFLNRVSRNSRETRI